MDPRTSGPTQAQTAVPAPTAGWRTGTAVLGVILYLLLIDTAVETFWSGAAVRWWVLGTVVLYLGVTAAAWRTWPPDWPTFGWSEKATATFFVFLGLIAVSVWTAGGRTGGVRMLGMTTVTMLTALVATAVVIACVTLLRMEPLPGWVKVVSCVASVYGVTALVLGIGRGSGFDDLFKGSSFWTTLPRWLQGSYAGALAVLAAGSVLSAVQASGLWKLSQRQAPGARRALALTLCLTIAASGSGAPAPAGTSDTQACVVGCGSDSGSSNPERPPRRLPSPEERRQIIDKLARYFSALDEAIARVPRDTFDPQAVVESAGRDPDALFCWVRDKTTLVPYQGVLRGPVGVLMDRLGNSLDRALLLHSLLTAAQHEARLARGRLTAPQVAALLARPRPASGQDRTAPSGGPTQLGGNPMREFAQRHGLDETELSTAAGRLTRDYEVTSARMSQRAQKQTEEIFDRVGKYRRENSGESTVRSEALGDHWWVQLAAGGRWIDMDPTWPDAVVGTALTTVLGTYVPGHVPVSLFHTVTIRVVVERVADGRASELTALEYTLRPFELLGKRVALRHLPMHWPVKPDFLQEKDPAAALKTRLIEESEWLPTLTVGTDRIARSSIQDSGNLNATPGTRGGRTGSIGGLAGGLVGGLTGGEPSPSSGPASCFTAEWIEYEIASPGQLRHRIRREVFDLLGPADRAAGSFSRAKTSEQQRLVRSLAMLRQTDLLLQVCDVAQAFIASMMGKSLVANRTAVLELLRLDDQAKADEVLPTLAKLVPMPAPVYFLAVARRIRRGDTPGVYLDRPNILGSVRGLRLQSSGHVVPYQGFDIVANELASWPAAGSDSFRERLQQGILDTNVETLGTADVEGGAQNTSEQYAASRANGIEWVVADQGSSRAWQGIALPKDVRVRIERELAEGYIAVVPSRPSQASGPVGVGWWRVDPRTGSALGIGPCGDGQDLAEYILHHLDVIEILICYIEAFHEGLEGRGLQMVLLLMVCTLLIPVKALVSVAAEPANDIFIKIVIAGMDIILEAATFGVIYGI